MNKDGAIVMKIHLQRPLRVKTGQSVSLWIPKMGFWQTHPFVITSWSDQPLTLLELLIQPRQGLTKALLLEGLARTDQEDHQNTNRIVLFGGPSGRSIPIGDYEVVLLVASGFGIAAQLPYVKELLHGYNARRIHTRRIHLVWQLNTIAESREFVWKFAVYGANVG
jgi:NAD(P)H-flavin reductase